MGGHVIYTVQGRLQVIPMRDHRWGRLRKPLIEEGDDPVFIVLTLRSSRIKPVSCRSFSSEVVAGQVMLSVRLPCGATATH